MIITADIHLHTFKAFADKKAEINSRLSNTLNVLNQMLEYTIEHYPIGKRLIIIVGDTFETKNVIEAITNNHFNDWVARCRDDQVELYIVVGNHDISSLGDESITLLHPLKYFENVKLFNSSEEIYRDGVYLYFVPFRRDQDFIRDDIAQYVKSHEKSAMADQSFFLFYHGAVLGAKISNREFLDAREAISVDDLKPKFFDQVFLGHFHKHQKLADNVRYVGSPLHHDIQDAGDQKGFYDYDPMANKLKFVKTTYPKFVILTVETEEDRAKLNEINDFDFFTVKAIGIDVQIDRPNVRIIRDIKKAKQSRLEVEFDHAQKIDSMKLIEAYVKHKNQNLNESELLDIAKKAVREVDC